jgi:hypothetical protein
VENPDLEKFPLFKDAEFVEGLLGPGEFLYIPVCLVRLTNASVDGGILSRVSVLASASVSGGNFSCGVALQANSRDVTRLSSAVINWNWFNNGCTNDIWAAWCVRSLVITV